MINDDPDFEVASSAGGTSFTSNSSSRLLRSTCHHQGPCHEGYGLQFHSRISPSPARSFRRRRRHKSGNVSTVESTPEDNEVPAPSPRPSVRRNLNEDLAKVERTSGWVADLPNFETRRLKLTTTTRKTWTDNQLMTMESTSTRSEEHFLNEEDPFKTPQKPTPSNKSSSPLSNCSSGSPRLRAFDGDAWKKSPRTGYTYVNSASYRNHWTPDREIPMPHMARWPLKYYNDGEVSFTSPQHNFGDLSCDEDDEVQEVVGERQSRFLLFLKSCKALLLLFTTAFSTVFVTQEPVQDVLQRQLLACLETLWKSLSFVLPCLGPLHVVGGSISATAEAVIQEEDEEEVTVVKKSTYFVHDIYNWTQNNNHRPLTKGGTLEDQSDEEDHDEIVEDITIIKRIIYNLLDIYIWTKKTTLKTTNLISKTLSRTTKIALSAPKTLLFLLVPSILTNINAESINGGTVSFGRNAQPDQPVVLEESYPHFRKLSENFNEVYTWTKRGTAAAFQSYVPDVRSAIKTLCAFVSGLFLSLLVALNPKTWIEKLPKISRRRIRRWRRKRSRGPPTRFSARIRKLPVQFTGELPKRTWTRRQVILEPKETRVEKIMKDFDQRVADFRPTTFTRSLSSLAEKLGYFKEEEVELRRSARLRGLQPEYRGLDHQVKRRQKSFYSTASGAEVDEANEEVHLENLMRPRHRTLLASLFAYFGFYDEEEIKRRRSLRLQGLDPEYEGLTWGKKSARKRRWYIFGDYHEDDEVFFEYHDQHEDGFLQRWLDIFLHKIGYLQFEDIHDEEDRHVDDEEIEEEEEEDYPHGYVEIPSDSFIRSQHQHEASFDNSYSFEPTEGVLDEEERQIKVTKDNSCLGILLLLAIPLLLLLSLAILDGNANESLEKVYSSIWLVPKWCGLALSFAKDLGFSIMSWITSFGLSSLNSIFAMSLNVFSGLWQGLMNILLIMSSPFNYLPSQEVNEAPTKTVDYETLTRDIFESEKFRALIRDSLKRDEDVEMQIKMLIEDNFKNVLHGLKNAHLLANEDLQQLQNEQSKLKDEQNNLKSLLMTEIQDLQTSEQSQTSVVSLQAQLEKAEKDLEQLMILVKKCCDKKNWSFDQEAFIRDHKDQFVTRKDFQIELASLLETMEATLLDISKKDIHDLLDRQFSIIQTNSTLNYHSGSQEDQLTRTQVQDMVTSALLTYGADKTGSFDFALETAGGSVVSTRCTQMYTARLPQYTWFGVPLWLPLPIWGPATNPRTAIQPGIMPGECWAFKGSEGFLVVKLAMPMKPTRFSIEHIPKSLSPNGQIDSAPKDFLVLGLQEERDANPQELGQFTYDQDGDPLQFFEVASQVDSPFSMVELRILNNHGNEDYTCLYRFRVHGSL